ILDGGSCDAGIESTIVAVREEGWEILRPGPVTEEHISALLGPQCGTSAVRKPVEAPGQLESHYAPGKPVRLNATAAGPDEFLIGFGPVSGSFDLSQSGDLAEAASRLYAALHTAAASQ